MILLEETEKEVEKPVGHIDDLRHIVSEPVMTPKELRFPWKVVIDGSRDAAVEKFRMGRRIEVAVEISGFV